MKRIIIIILILLGLLNYKITSDGIKECTKYHSESFCKEELK